VTHRTAFDCLGGQISNVEGAKRKKDCVSNAVQDPDSENYKQEVRIATLHSQKEAKKDVGRHQLADTILLSQIQGNFNQHSTAPSVFEARHSYHVPHSHLGAHEGPTKPELRSPTTTDFEVTFPSKTNDVYIFPNLGPFESLGLGARDVVPLPRQPEYVTTLFSRKFPSRFPKSELGHWETTFDSQDQGQYQVKRQESRYFPRVTSEEPKTQSTSPFGIPNRLELLWRAHIGKVEAT